MATRFYSSVEYGRKDDSTDPDVLYYNASVINNTTQSDGNNFDDPQVIFNEVRQYPLLQDTSDYMMSVVRFTMNGATKNLPLFIPRVVPNQPDVDFLVYKIRLAGVAQQVVGGASIPFDEEVNLSFTPENVGVTPPITTTPQNLNTNYYYVYTYSHFCYLVNSALDTAVSNVNAALGFTTQARVPRLSYDPSTKRFSFNVDARYYGSGQKYNATIPPGPAVRGEFWELLIDENLESLLTNFYSVYYNTPAAGPFAGWTKIEIGDQNTTTDILIDPSTGIPYSPATGYINYVVTQDYPSTSGAWSPVDSICLTSSQLPLIPEQVSPPQEVGSSNTGWSQPTAAAGFQTIATDIAIDLKGAEDYRQFILYQPTAEYRMSSLNSSKQPLQNFDFACWWRCRIDNNLYPLRLYNGTSVSLKVMFRKRQLGV